MPTLHNKSRIRWLPAAIIVALTVLVLILIWSLEAAHRQSQVFYTVLLLILSFLLMLLWLLFFSRLRWKVRLLAFGAVVLVILLSTTLFRVKGFSGDLVPLLEWRWGEKAAESLTGSAPTASGAFSKDYPQFLGPHRNGTVQGIKLARDWSEASAAAFMAATHRCRLVGFCCRREFGSHPRAAWRIRNGCLLRFEVRSRAMEP